jgi:hypothetical protein
MLLPKVCFYVPSSEVADQELPDTIENYWPWISSSGQVNSWGPFSWTLQTYLYLKADGFPCELRRSLPTEGIVVAHRDFLPTNLRPGKDLLVACILADREEPGFIGRHPYAQVHIVQNPRDPMVSRLLTIWRGYYIPYWPQPSLIRRDAALGDRFEVAAFFGYQHNLAPELRDARWTAALEELGLTWWVAPRERWHDYSNVDVVVAVRSFTNANSYIYKPPSKLHNAWCAGVPAVLGCEAAYQASRRSDFDYLEVHSRDEAVTALRRLRDNPSLRRTMKTNGDQRAAEIGPERIVQLWRNLVSDELVRIYQRWRHAPHPMRTAFLALRTKAFYRVMAKRHPDGVRAPAYPRSAGTDFP